MVVLFNDLLTYVALRRRICSAIVYTKTISIVAEVPRNVSVHVLVSAVYTAGLPLRRPGVENYPYGFQHFY